ncbi:MAG: hypothetical protein AVDCRST_MAG29-348 [uncultured Nocardioidaceae bacterium]|uniref:Uncharacterized protein n=1 Tax=uncultured Nocardioidaceae bacterium TaxID=253824 RepID=A0A6J4L1J0_9ACTN|nr:MAG: hypothetical protein AVDCRST_MAG29-348 [uncultured Nocardioidaceae bacterium]
MRTPRTRLLFHTGVAVASAFLLFGDSCTEL